MDEIDFHDKYRKLRYICARLEAENFARDPLFDETPRRLLEPGVPELIAALLAERDALWLSNAREKSREKSGEIRGF